VTEKGEIPYLRRSRAAEAETEFSKITSRIILVKSLSYQPDLTLTAAPRCPCYTINRQNNNKHGKEVS
jgi:hypothetical protein